MVTRMALLHQTHSHDTLCQALPIAQFDSGRWTLGRTWLSTSRTIRQYGTCASRPMDTTSPQPPPTALLVYGAHLKSHLFDSSLATIRTSKPWRGTRTAHMSSLGLVRLIEQYECGTSREVKPYESSLATLAMSLLLPARQAARWSQVLTIVVRLFCGIWLEAVS